MKKYQIIIKTYYEKDDYIDTYVQTLRDGITEKEAIKYTNELRQLNMYNRSFVQLQEILIVKEYKKKK